MKPHHHYPIRGKAGAYHYAGIVSVNNFYSLIESIRKALFQRRLYRLQRLKTERQLFGAIFWLGFHWLKI
jgi:hypothetical protein